MDASLTPCWAGRLRRIGLQLTAVVALLALIVWANVYASEHDLVREAARGLGYPGIFAAAAISGFNLVVPVPVIAFFPFFMEVGLDPVMTVVVIAIGMTAGDLVGYLVGRAARDMVRPKDGGVIRRLESLRERHPYLPLAAMFLYASFAPIPNEVLVLPLAFLRYPVGGILVAVLAGNMIFNGLIALGVFHFFEIF